MNQDVDAGRLERRVRLWRTNMLTDNEIQQLRNDNLENVANEIELLRELLTCCRWWIDPMQTNDTDSSVLCSQVDSYFKEVKPNDPVQPPAQEGQE